MEKIKKDWEAEVAKQVKAKLNHFLKDVQGSDEMLKNEDGGALANELWKSTSQEVAACHASVAEKEINTRLAQLAKDIGAQGGKIDKIGFEGDCFDDSFSCCISSLKYSFKTFRFQTLRS